MMPTVNSAQSCGGDRPVVQGLAPAPVVDPPLGSGVEGGDTVHGDCHVPTPESATYRSIAHSGMLCRRKIVGGNDGR
jgi:hypothetical protein